MDREMGLKKNGDHLNHHHTSIAISHGNQIPTSVSMVDSFPGLWSHSTNSQNLGFFENSLQTTMNTFIDPATRFPCFNGESFSGTVNPFSTCESMNPYSDASNVLDYGSNGYREPGFNGGERKETPDSSNGSEDSSFKGVAAKKKKKRSHQDMELEQLQGCPQLSGETRNENVGSKEKVEEKSSMGNGKQGKDSSDGGNDDYIHVRAKRGQATNSHSLAERVRRERISERMKYLQELVPGCSKVTGKAVMLDEIINYVQSLQRQVEFLSMKLAAINPRLDLNLEGLLLKDLQSRGGPSTIGFSPDMMHTQLHPSQQGLVQPGISDLVNHSDALRIAVHAQLTAINGYKEPPPQAPNAWDNQLHNVFQMTFGANPPIDTQELKGTPRDGFPL